MAPISAYVCEECGEPLRPDQPGVWRKVVGFVQARVGGGAHGISDEYPLGVYYHRVCFELRKHHRGKQETLDGFEQPGLFGDEPEGA